MQFGLMNAPAVFQRAMDELFHDLIGVGVNVYLDDIIIYAETEQVHWDRVREVLKRLRKADFYCKPEKCYFDVPEVEFLGLIIRHNEIAMDPVKIDGVVGWKPPTCLKDVRSFLLRDDSR